MQKQPARIIPFPAIDPESTDDGAFAWPRRPTCPLFSSRLTSNH